jgi:hypothetical protein
MARTYIPSNPTYICDVVHAATTTTLNVCADTPELAADTAINEVIRHTGPNHGVQHCHVYNSIAHGTPAANVPYNPNKHTQKDTTVSYLKRVK